MRAPSPAAPSLTHVDTEGFLTLDREQRLPSSQIGKPDVGGREFPQRWTQYRRFRKPRRTLNSYAKSYAMPWVIHLFGRASGGRLEPSSALRFAS